MPFVFSRFFIATIVCTITSFFQCHLLHNVNFNILFANTFVSSMTSFFLTSAFTQGYLFRVNAQGGFVHNISSLFDETLECPT